MFKILDRYILKKFLTTYFFVVLILISVLMVIDFTEKNDDFLKTKPGAARILGEYYLNFFPYWANLLSPITVFIATVFVTAQLSNRTEIIAILSSGVSFLRFLWPYFLGSLLIGGLIFFLVNNVIPHSNKKRVAFEVKYIKKPFSYDKQNVHFRISDNGFAYLQSYNNSINTGYQFTLENINQTRLLSKIKAERIVWSPERKKWKMENYTIREMDSLGQAKITKGVELDTTLNLYPKDFENQHALYETFTTGKLTEVINEMENRGQDNIEPYRIERYLRITYPFAIVILTMIGVILSARKSRGGSGLQIAVGFMLAFVYIIFFILSRSIANAGAMDPLLATWMPNIIFSIIGVVLYKTVPR